MNVSSIVVRCLEEHSDFVKSELAKRDCTVHFSNGPLTILTIEPDNLNGESEFVNELEGIPHVTSAGVMYAYNEQEIEESLERIYSMDKVAELLNEDNDADSIKYKGDINSYNV